MTDIHAQRDTLNNNCFLNKINQGMNDTTGSIYLKVVNTTAKKETVKVNLSGINKVSPEAALVVVKGAKPDDTNSITNPEKIVPVTSTIKDVKPAFSRTLDPYSISIFELKTIK